MVSSPRPSSPAQDTAPTTAVHSTDDLGLHHIPDEDFIDPRISPTSTLRPSNSDLEEGLSGQLEDYVDPHHHIHRSKKHGKHEPNEKTQARSKEDVIYVEFVENDRRNPVNFTHTTKWVITISASVFTALTAASSSSYNQGFPTMTRDLHCTDFQATIGLAVFCLGYGVIPLATASLSENFGRMPLYLISTTGYTLSHLMVALAPNITTVILGRFFNGAFGSTGATMVGGTIADIWQAHERGLPMAIYSVSALASTGLGAVGAAWIEMNPHLGWRWIQWIHLIITGVYLLAMPVLLRETRAGVLLTRMAQRLRRETGDGRYRARAEDERGSLGALIWVSCTRPIYLLVLEPVVIFLSLWLGFIWGILYCMIESIAPVFRDLHHTNIGLTGTAYITVTIGALVGLLFNTWQERLYANGVAKHGAEARLYCACAAGIAFPIGMFIYAWSSFPFVPWIALCIGIVIVIASLYTIYVAVFSYLADCYGPFASSALAGQSLFRNMMGMAFPLFTAQMFSALTYKWANTIFACIALIMIPIPFVLFFYGPAIRARSKFASQVMER